ncbi:MAG: iron chaperone [Opitutia bacterium]
MAKRLPADIEGYLAKLRPELGATLREILGFVAAEFPALGLRLAWNVPHATLGAGYVAGMSAARNHLSFSPWSTAALAAHRGRLGKLESTANLIRIPPGWALDRPLLRSLIRARLAELEAVGSPAAPKTPVGRSKGLPRRRPRPI